MTRGSLIVACPVERTAQSADSTWNLTSGIGNRELRALRACAGARLCIA
jgi:hypothetical protein